MVQTRISTVVLFLAASLTLGVPANAETIPLSTIEDLQKIGNDDAFPLNGSYVLTQDMDARATATWNDGAGFDPIGEYNYFSSSKSFKGTLDGQGHVILGLNINR
ncbi:MAG TPA: carboxypeptidase regulatory-like domain-containing protein, partial [Candidatus Hydrogenedentes bacterium]|nr:carboxypeptidase regulatory-like domain-containing protein [Candidatus Hydrogenedentota bacterium]